MTDTTEPTPTEETTISEPATLPAWRNPVLTPEGGVDCEIEHPEFGWIPFHATADDVEPLGRAIHAAALASAAPAPAPTPDDVRRSLTQAIQNHLDTTAQQRNYDSILSLCTYATSTNAKFATEGRAGVEWRDTVWALGYDLLDQAMAGEIEIPPEDELLAQLPVMVWPIDEETTA